MKSSPSVCPVPAEQQPLNEYRDLQESWFFRWGTFEQPKYVRVMVWVWAWSWIVTGPVAAASFAPAKHPVQFVLIGAGGASLVLLLVMVHLYLGWAYINNRLSSKTVVYEESGWYDGQSWSKPPETVIQDQLVVTYQVQPILQRLRRTLGILVALLLSGTLLWNLM